ncbi:MAG: hypothetical protein KDB74_10690 [Flavobacteriales bacterium]|nr:hypothetical protein [Flavobacteriales bacterium]
MNLLKIIIISIILLIGTSLFGQKTDKEPLTFDLYEIQIFTGLTINGDHILKLDKDGMLLKRNDFNSMKDSQADVVNFHYLASQLDDSELKDFRKNYNSFLQFIEEFDFKNYIAIKEVIDTVIVDGKTQIREKLISTHDLGTRILITDKDMKTYFIQYQFCDKTLDKLLDSINQLIPAELREKYKFKKKCS